MGRYLQSQHMKYWGDFKLPGQFKIPFLLYRKYGSSCGSCIFTNKDIYEERNLGQTKTNSQDIFYDLVYKNAENILIR